MTSLYLERDDLRGELAFLRNKVFDQDNSISRFIHSKERIAEQLCEEQSLSIRQQQDLLLQLNLAQESQQVSENDRALLLADLQQQLAENRILTKEIETSRHKYANDTKSLKKTIVDLKSTIIQFRDQLAEAKSSSIAVSQDC